MLRQYKFIFVTIVFLFVSAVSCDENKQKKMCGNGKLDPGEICDPAMTEYAGICTLECRLVSHCGNGLTETGEECDDGNLMNGDGCSRECRVEKGCGNGVLDFVIVDGRLVIEECDDDNLVDGDGCSATCRLEGEAICGNGLLEWPEQCDDANTQDGDGCSATCDVESGCGDGRLNSSLEQCDDGNRINGDGCSAFCRREFVCGDGVCDEDAGEHCEFCLRDCCPRCGDENLDEGEECDDGNNIRFDGCSTGCMDEDQTPTCGNGIWERSEECDDGNLENGDGCSSACLREFVVEDGVCESLKGETCRLSPADCCPNCGNGELDPGEECDGTQLDGKTCEQLCYDGGQLGCTPWCSFSYEQCTGTGPICGNNRAECAEQCDGTDLQERTCETFGYAEGTITCTANCRYNISNCSGFLYYAFSNFDDSPTLPMGWSSAGSWTVGTPTSGPTSAYSAPRCISTSMNSDYTNNMTYNANYVRLPSINLINATNPVMTFYSWLEAELNYDGGRVEISTDGGMTWLPATDVSPPYHSSTKQCWSGNTSATMTWNLYTVSLASYVGSIIDIRFAFMSDSSIVYDGWYIDDVIITEQ